MKFDDTICYKVDAIFKMLENDSEKIELIRLTELLHAIRSDANRMEIGLKKRKELMLKHNLEAEYKALKAESQKHEGINLIAEEEEHKYKGRRTFEVILKEGDKILYRNKAHALIFCSVEKMTDIDAYGVIDGTTQKFTAGNPVAVWYAFDQLRQGIEARHAEITAAMKQMVMSNAHTDPEIRAKLSQLV